MFSCHFTLINQMSASLLTLVIIRELQFVDHLHFLRIRIVGLFSKFGIVSQT